MMLRIRMSRLLVVEIGKRKPFLGRFALRPTLLYALLMSSFAVSATAAMASDKVERIIREADGFRSSNAEQFEASLQSLEALAREATPLQQQKIEYLRAYNSAMYADRFDDAISRGISLYRKAKSEELRFRAATLVANTAAIKRDFTTGLKYMGLGLTLRKKVDDAVIRHDGINSIAILYNQMGQYSLGRKYASEVLAESPQARRKCFAGNIVLEADQRLGRPLSAGRFQATIDDCVKAGEPIAINMTRAFWAMELAKNNDIVEAIAILEKSLPEVQATKYPRLIAGFHAVLAEIKLKLGDTKSAEEHAQATVALGEQIKSSSTLVSAYNTLYQIAATREKPSVALELYKRYAESEMAHQTDVKAKELAYEIVRHETKQQAQQLALERASTQKARLVAGFLLVMLGAIVFWVIQIKRHQGQLQRLAQTDALTGLGNRHFFTLNSERTLVEAARAGDTAALVMFDLDHFKAINDTYGHGAGDWVLKQVGKTCNAHCRKIDYIGRIGGEEFAVLLHGFDLASAARMAEDCRSQLAQIDTRECGYSFVVTASFGVSSTALSGYDLSRLLSHADQMLYRAKNEGRNRVCAYTAEAAVDHKSPKRSPTLTVINN